MTGDDGRESFTLPGQEFDENGIECPNCGCRDWRTTHVYQLPDMIKRRRQCRHCPRKIVTFELRLLRVAQSETSPQKIADLPFPPKSSDG